MTEAERTTTSSMPCGRFFDPTDLIPTANRLSLGLSPSASFLCRIACLERPDQRLRTLTLTWEGGLGVEEVRVSQSPWAAYLAKSSLSASISFHSVLWGVLRTPRPDSVTPVPATRGQAAAVHSGLGPRVRPDNWFWTSIYCTRVLGSGHCGWSVFPGRSPVEFY